MSTNNRNHRQQQQQQQQLHVGLLGKRLTGDVSKWMGSYGFIRVDGYEGRVYLTNGQFKDEGRPATMNTNTAISSGALVRVEFTLDRNERGWRAVDCRRILDQEVVTVARTAVNSTHTATRSRSAAPTPASTVKFPVLYNPKERDKDNLEVFDKSVRLFQLLNECKSPHTPRSKRTLAATYTKLIEDLNNETVDKEFTRYPSSALRVNWQRVKDLQNMKDSKDKHTITIEDLHRLESFQSFLQRPVLAETITELLSEYAANISTNTSLPVFAKAAWMFFYLWKIMMDNIREGEEDTGFLFLYLLMNWVLLQQGVLIMTDSLYLKDAPRRKIDIYSSDLVHDCVLVGLVKLFQELDQRMKDTLMPQDPVKVLNNHRKQMHEYGDCYMCSDDAAVNMCPTVSTLCCAKPAHACCLHSWRKFLQERDNEGKRLADLCPICKILCPEPSIGNQQGNPPASGSSRPVGVMSSNNAFAVLQDDDDYDGWPENDGLYDDFDDGY